MPTPAPSASRPPRFTLIELLVVVAIIAILAALLLPVLGRAKHNAKRLVNLSNMRQVALAFTSYADANDGWLPAKATANSPSFPNWYKYVANDLRAPATQYGAIEVTENPVVDAPAWHRNPESAGSMSWFYWPGQPGLGTESPSRQLVHARPTDAIFQDQLYWEAAYGYAAVNVYRGQYVAKTGTHPSDCYFRSYIEADIRDSATAFYDGSGRYVAFHAMTRSSHLGWGWYAWYAGQ